MEVLVVVVVVAVAVVVVVAAAAVGTGSYTTYHPDYHVLPLPPPRSTTTAYNYYDHLEVVVESRVGRRLVVRRSHGMVGQRVAAEW